MNPTLDKELDRLKLALCFDYERTSGDFLDTLTPNIITSKELIITLTKLLVEDNYSLSDKEHIFNVFLGQLKNQIEDIENKLAERFSTN